MPQVELAAVVSTGSTGGVVVWTDSTADVVVSPDTIARTAGRVGSIASAAARGGVPMRPDDEVLAAATRVFRTTQAARAFLALPTPEFGGETPQELVRTGREADVLAFLARLEQEAPPQPNWLFSAIFGRLGGR